MRKNVAAASAAVSRYSRGAIALHWIIAAAIILQIGIGWYMGTLEHTPWARTVEGVHISLGLTVLILSVIRVVWRLTHVPPPLPAGISTLERSTAGVTIVLFYVLMFALPVSGWIMESFGPRPIPFWGLSWPHFPGIEAMAKGMIDPRAAKETIEEIHGSPMVWAMLALIFLHVAGALKHQFEGRPILWRMAGWLKQP